MKCTVSVTERINLGNFEYVEITAGVDFDTEEVSENPEAFARQQIDVLLRCHRRRAYQMLPEDSESFLAFHPALDNEEK